uniref:Uncharacterized protein n=1 Tax=Anguilla anguilla TaxID=7936 RepID=A0A0E9QT11_ANGAN
MVEYSRALGQHWRRHGRP